MVRPRWHDVLIAAGIIALLLAGLWALWWDDLRSYLHPHEKVPVPTIPSPSA